MKTHFYLVLLLVLILILKEHSFCQTTYSLLISHPEDEYCSEAIELDDGSILFSIIASESFGSPFKSQLVKVTVSGYPVYGPVFENPDGKCLIRNFVRTGENSIVCAGEWEWTSQHTKLWYLGIDSSLNTIWDKKYPVWNDWLKSIRSLFDSQGNIVSCISVSKYLQPYIDKVLLFKTTINGDSVSGIYSEPEESSFIYDIIEFDSGYQVFTPGYSQYSWTQSLHTDYNFSILNIDSVPNLIDNVVTAKKCSDTTYYLSGNISFGYSGGNVSIGLYDKENDELISTTVGKQDTLDYGGADQSMDYSDKNSIYLAGTSNMDYTYYSTSNSWYFLSNFDSSLNLRWTRFYGGDAYYVLRSVVATLDGGAFLIGTKYDDELPDQKLDLYLVKADSLGLITGIDNPIQSGCHDAIVYPNPGSDYLMIESGPQISGAVFRMFDIQGKELLQTELTQTSCRVSTAHLPSGTYIWNIVANDMVIETGKWMLVR